MRVIVVGAGDAAQLVDERYKKFRRMGVFEK